MSGPDANADASTQSLEVGTIDTRLEVLTVPVSDADRDQELYPCLGWRSAADIVATH